jgi:hypothetical protein
VIRLIVFAVIGLVLGLGGGSGFAVMRAKKTIPTAADSTANRDSASARTAHSESTSTVGGERAHVADAPVDSSALPVAGATKQESAAAPTSAGATKAGLGDSARTDVPSAPGRIAKIFAAMSAKDAARVLQQLDDADVQTVLGGLNDRQAAAILAGFPPERAAAISRAVMRGKKGAS